jgi:hypothetical protein
VRPTVERGVLSIASEASPVRVAAGGRDVLGRLPHCSDRDSLAGPLPAPFLRRRRFAHADRSLNRLLVEQCWCWSCRRISRHQGGCGARSKRLSCAGYRGDLPPRLPRVPENPWASFVTGGLTDGAAEARGSPQLSQRSGPDHAVGERVGLGAALSDPLANL